MNDKVMSDMLGNAFDKFNKKSEKHKHPMKRSKMKYNHSTSNSSNESQAKKNTKSNEQLNPKSSSKDRIQKKSPKKQPNPKSSKDKQKESSNHKSNKASKSKTERKNQNSAPKHQPQLLWNMQADVRAIAKLNALEKIYGLKNRTQALDLLYENCLDKLIDNADDDDSRADFQTFYRFFIKDTKNKAIKRYKKQAERNKKK